MLMIKDRLLLILALLLVVMIAFNPITVLCEGEAQEPGSEAMTEAQGEEIYDEGAYEDEIIEGFDEELYIDEGTEEADEIAEIAEPYSRAKVIKVIGEEDRSFGGADIGISAPTQIVEVKIVKGPHKGETVRSDYSLSYNFNSEYKMSQLKEGDEVLLYIEENDDGTIATAYVAEFARDRYLLYLVIAFAVALVVIGRAKGLKAVISLILTAIAVVKILIPAILAGKNPVITSVIVCASIIGFTMLIISGPNKKTLSAIIGTVGGVIIAGIIAIIVGSLARLTGLGSDESQMLMYIPQNIHFDFRGLLFAGILIGTMGANMDVGMSIASAMHEVKAHNPRITTVDLMKAGMNVGRDVMATMSNTLILAYAGSSLPLMLLLMAYNTPFSHIINWDIIASEVVRAIAGSMGLVFTIPVTAFVAAQIEERLGKDQDKARSDEHV